MWRFIAPLAFLFASSAHSAPSPSSSSSSSSDGGTVWVTPHDSYSSSVGVPGCKVDVNRIAYWPASVSCTNLCVELSYDDRSVYLLRVDQSQGAYDVSYDAWNYLYTGYSATKKPTSGGAVEMTYKAVDASKCKDLIKTDDGKLPLSAANSMNFLVSCLDSSSWVGSNYVLYNILDSICTLGYNEECNLDWPAANQASCPHTLGLQVALNGQPVYNIQYPSGDTVLATNGTVVSSALANTTEADDSLAPTNRSASSLMLSMLAICALVLGSSWI